MDDPQAFEELVARYQNVVCAVAYSLLRDRGRSEEIAQEAFLIAWQKLPAMSSPPKMPAWVCGIARNLAANARRRRKEDAMETEPAASGGTPLDAMLDREQHELAAGALASLGEADREAFVLYYRGDGSIADVAATLGITESAARQRLHRGRERLKSALTSVEAALRATRPSHAFTAACVAALATRSATSSAATRSTGRATKLALPIAGALVIGGAITVALLARSNDASTADVVQPATNAISTAPLDAAFIRRLDPSVRRARIDKLQQQRDAEAARAGSDTGHRLDTRSGMVKTYDFSGGALADLSKVPPPDPKTLGKATMRFAIKDIQPLLLECYTTAFDRLSRKDGTLEIKLVLVGELDQPTLVESVEFGGDAHLTRDADFVECMRETLFTIEMPAMTDTETWVVHYPLVMPGHR